MSRLVPLPQKGQHLNAILTDSCVNDHITVLNFMLHILNIPAKNIIVYGRSIGVLRFYFSHSRHRDCNRRRGKLRDSLSGQVSRINLAEVRTPFFFNQ